jgi:hypothetical protein
MTATPATAARFYAVRAEGRYRVIDGDLIDARQDGDAPGSAYVAVCASRAKAEEKAAKLNAEVAEVAPADARQETATELAQAVADGAVSFDDAAAALLSGNGAALVAELSGPTNDEAEWLAHVNADTVSEAQAQADADEAEMDRMVAEAERAEDERVAAEKAARDEALAATPAPAPEAPEQPAAAAAVQSVRIPRRIVEHITEGKYDAALKAVIAARKPTADGARTVKLDEVQRGAVLAAAVNAEQEARWEVSAGKITGVSYVLAATSLQKRLRGEVAAPAAAKRTEVTASVDGARKVRLPRRVIGHLSGSHAWQVDGEEDTPMMRRIQEANKRTDGSCTVELSPAEREALTGYVEAFAAGAGDEAGDGSLEQADRLNAVADLNAARATIAALAD